MAPYTFAVYERFRRDKQDIDIDYLTSALIDHSKSEKQKEDTKAYATSRKFGKQQKPEKSQK